MAASEETSEKEDERATIFFFFFGWKFDLRSLYDSYGYGFIFAPDLFPRNGKSYYGTSEPCFLANSLRGNCFRLFDLRSKLTIRNSFSIRSRKSIRLALIGGFIAIHFFYFFFSLSLATEGRKCALSFRNTLNQLRIFASEKFFRTVNRDVEHSRNVRGTIIRIIPLYIPRVFEARTKAAGMKARGRILGTTRTELSELRLFFSTARYFNALIAAVRLSPPSSRGRGEVSSRFGWSEARRYREISRRDTAG